MSNINITYDQLLHLISRHLSEGLVKRISSNSIVVSCPLCHFMLDAKQRTIEKELKEKIDLPVFYITQLLGIALGIDNKNLGIQRLVTSPKRLIQKIG